MQLSSEAGSVETNDMQRRPESFAALLKCGEPGRCSTTEPYSSAPGQHPERRRARGSTLKRTSETALNSALHSSLTATVVYRRNLFSES
jgi:hypothetical protein